jgi:hypothetical protein
MYAKLNNGVVETYPYSIGQLRKDFPNTSFPKVISKATLDAFNVVEVQAVTPPTVTHLQVWHEATPVLDNGVWKQSYTVSDVSAEDLASRTEGEKERIRQTRNELLSGSDWTQVADSPVDKDAWATYRQALRDIPDQAGFPWEVTWPEMSE